MQNILLIPIFLILYSPSCFAYIDPGTGSLIVQGLIAAFAAGMYTMRLYWHKIKSFFSSKKINEDDNEEINDSE